jgi:hypothetical protein
MAIAFISKLKTVYKVIAMFILFTFLIVNNSIGQTINFTIIDSVSKEPLAFASVTYKKQNYLSDHLGKVKLQLIDILDKDTVYITYIGYSTKKISVFLLTNNSTVRLLPNDYQIEDVTIRGFKKDKLFEWVKNGILSIRKNTKPFVARISTFSYNNVTYEPLEYLDGNYNIITNQTNISGTELIEGGIIFNKDNLYSNYMSVGNTKLLVSSNISGMNNGYFFNPFLTNFKSINSKMKLDYKLLDDQNMLIYFKHPLVNGSIQFDRASMSIISMKYNWTYYKNLPIQTLSTQAKLSDTITIECTHYFENNKFKSQHLVMHYQYNISPIITHSYMTSLSEGNKNISIGGIGFNNDYMDILANPYFTNYSFLANQSDEFIELISNALNTLNLIEGKDVDRKQIEEITGISYFDPNWLLNWALFTECNIEKGTDTYLKLGLLISNDTSNDNKGKVKLYLDYFASTYCYEKNENGANYILMAMLIGEKYRRKLDSHIQQYTNSTSYNKLISVHKQALKEMNAEIWKMKFETNGGYNSDEVLKWHKMLVEFYPTD